MTIDLQTDGRAVRDGISAIRDVAQSMLDSEVPTKRQRSNLVKKAESLIALQKSVVDKIPDLVPADCTKYALTCLNASKNYEITTQSLKRAPRENMRKKSFLVDEFPFALPSNKTHYTAAEVCSILVKVEEAKKTDKKNPSPRKVITTMINYERGSLIPCSYLTMKCILRQYKENPNIEWPVKRQKPIDSNSVFMNTAEAFESDQGRAMSKDDMIQLLKDSKVEVAKRKGTSTLIISSPTTRTRNNYMSLLPQLDAK